jgi:hypothetical protein
MYVRNIAACAALLVAACAPHRHAEAPLSGDELQLEVANNNWSDVIIYMLHDGVRTRFIAVTAARSATAAIPTRYVSSNGTVQILVHRIGGNDEYVSPVVSVRLGRTVALTLESNLARSSLGVW